MDIHQQIKKPNLPKQRLKNNYEQKKEIIENFLKDSKNYFNRKDDNEIICKILKGGYWSTLSKLPKRDMDTIYLSNEEKDKAAMIYRCLNYCKKNKLQPIPKLKEYIIEKFKKTKEIDLEYIEFVALNSMLPIKNWGEEKNNVVCIAAHIKKVRLIDNIIL